MPAVHPRRRKGAWHPNRALPWCCALALSCGAAAREPTAPEGAPSGLAPAPAEPSEGIASAPEEPGGPRPPDFEIEALDGSSFRLSEHLPDRVVLLDFWATFCDPCLAAMPHLEALYQAHKDRGFLVVGVSIDGPDSLAQVRSQVRKTGVTFPILLDVESTVLARYNPRTSAPFSVLIGRDGRILKKQEGYTTGSGRELERDVEQALTR